jgi:hypothetical protein
MTGLVASIIAFPLMWERGDERYREEHDHPRDDQQVGHRDEDESPVEIAGR